MLFDSRTEQNAQGFKPNVDNAIRPAKATGGQKFIIILCIILTLDLGYIWVIVRKNDYRRKQINIMNASSTIQAAQAKRYATLTKMLNVVLGYAQHEKSTLTEVTKMRQQLAALSNETDTAKLSSGLEAIKAGLNIQLERYPELKADRLYLQLSSEISLQEDEIYAAIRIYNQKVTAFNSEIYNFPIVYVAEKLQLHNMALFEASEKERADVDMSALVK